MENMTNAPVTPAGARRNEDIALDLMKFIVVQTDIGRAATVGFTSAGAKPASGDELAERLLDLYTRCLKAVDGKRG